MAANSITGGYGRLYVVAPSSFRIGSYLHDHCQRPYDVQVRLLYSMVLLRCRFRAYRRCVDVYVAWKSTLVPTGTYRLGAN